MAVAASAVGSSKLACQAQEFVFSAVIDVHCSATRSVHLESFGRGSAKKGGLENDGTSSANTQGTTQGDKGGDSK